jgi:hypothetical protein
MKIARAPAFFALLGATLLALPAAADTPDPETAAFDRAVQQMEAGRYEQACPAIEQSYQREPRPGKLFTLAWCQEKRGLVATAVALYDDYLTVAAALPPDKKQKQGDREKIARAQKALLAPMVPELTLALPPGAPSGTVIKRDGAVVAEGAPFPLDPGEHLITAHPPNGPVTEVRVRLEKGEKKSLVLDVREASPPARAPVTEVPPEAPVGPSRPVLIAGASLTGLGVVLGAIFAAASAGEAARAGSAYPQARKTGCPPRDTANLTGLCGDLRSALASRAAFADVSAWSFIGAGAVGTGTLLYALSAPRAASTAVRVLPVVTARGGGVMAGATW